MAQPVSAQDLVYRVAFDERVEIDDGAGNTVGDWQERFQCRAAFRHLRGGESVMASRLQGHHVQIITVRSLSQARQVTTDWRVRDVRTGVAFNIRDVTHEVDRQFIAFLCESGVATG
ncbi:phage head closure protein [Mesorhizobium sp. RMAD-H1]|uniref:phage head closure protein n=1 Tax=Mesorhizobium sp. RMAD-H1 TaxID=2587065 RepID=UPI0016099338|nr:phage head closure protein [Mesorhizobium sp. RMAD-H1]MBB2973951.1 SPP1 family predicted phage head-tail adaptor [Mesorhizobium sp. RMAD-H1]